MIKTDLNINKQTKYINHIAFLLDRSGSIKLAGLERSMIEVFDNQIKHLKVRSKELDQPTYISVYLFNQTCERLFHDIEINKIDSIAKYYKAEGDTALIRSTIEVIDDLSNINTKIGNHSTLLYIQTDGENRMHHHLADELNHKIKNLPDDFTIAALVPDHNGVHECKKWGFPPNNIQIWDSKTKKGFQEVSETMMYATDSYMVARSRGMKGTKNLFTLDASNLKKTEVKRNLIELNPKEYELLPVRKDGVAIKEYVEDWLGQYRVGSAYYEMNKKETVQSNKNLAVQDKLTGKIYTGINARNLLNLPSYEVKVNPVSYGNYRLFCQSTSVNRKLVKGTQLLVLK